MEALRAFGDEHGRHTTVAHWLRQDILRRNAQDERDAARDRDAEETEPALKEQPGETDGDEPEDGEERDTVDEPLDVNPDEPVSAPDADGQHDGEELAAAA